MSVRVRLGLASVREARRTGLSKYNSNFAEDNEPDNLAAHGVPRAGKAARIAHTIVGPWGC